MGGVKKGGKGISHPRGVSRRVGKGVRYPRGRVKKGVKGISHPRGVSRRIVHSREFAPTGRRVGKGFPTHGGCQEGLLEDDHLAGGGVIACGEVVEIYTACDLLAELVSAVPVDCFCSALVDCGELVSNVDVADDAPAALIDG